MPKNTKVKKPTKTRTRVKDLRGSTRDLSSAESKKVKGGLDPTEVRLPSTARSAGNHQPQKV